MRPDQQHGYTLPENEKKKKLKSQTNNSRNAG